MSNPNSKELTPAQQLVGRNLNNGWTIVKRILKTQSATGGFFSASYIVRSDKKREAFLKAMDYRRALSSPEPAKALQAMTSAYVFEKNLLEKCKGMSHVVTILDSGKIEPSDDEPSNVVEYLIFEKADGDIRSYVDTGRAFETAWALRTIHQAAVALWQLHRARIAHQDLKPSNVLVFGEKDSKVADLGRAFDQSNVSPHDDLDIAGDNSYAPPELLYGHTPPDWQARRLGCDLYLLGSLIVFFCTSGFSMTHLLMSNMASGHHYTRWDEDFEAVLPYLLHAFSKVVGQLRENVQQEHAGKIAELVTQLCYPDPKIRGKPKSIASPASQYSLERYVSMLGNLASRAEYSLKRKRPLKKNL